MLPLFLYLTTVTILRPNADMYFYSCPNKGQVVGYSQDLNDIFWYRIRLLCNGRRVETHIPQAQLRQEIRK
jgi:hypothetical protein